jgi:uncharacterized spore protein YtfJ
MADTKGKVEGKAAEGAEQIAATLAGELGEIMGRAARVDTVFGDPVTQDGLTVVPVARARWGFGGGRRLGGDGEARGGMGGGGGMRVDPVGIVVIRGDDAEFRPIKVEPRWGLLLGLAAIGFVIGRF